MSRESTRQTVLWAVVTAAVFAAVLGLSMQPRIEAALGSSVATGSAPAPEAPVGSPDPDPPQTAAANPWAQFAARRQFTVLAEDAVKLEGAMQLQTGPDNEGVTGPDGQPAKVRFTWCADDGCAEEEKEDAAIAGAAADHWAEFDMNVPAGGVYYPWARVWWQDSCGNSIVVRWGRDGGMSDSFVVQDGTLESWHWLPVAGPEGIRLSKGAYRLAVVNREDGARLSRILFSGKSYETYKPETPEG